MSTSRMASSASRRPSSAPCSSASAPNSASCARRSRCWRRLYYDLRKPAFEKRKKAIRKVMQLDFGITAPVTFVSHHLCHAAGAYYASGYDEALVATLDGAGDGDSSHVYSVKNGRFELLHSVSQLSTALATITATSRDQRLQGRQARGQDHRACGLWQTDPPKRVRKVLPLYQDGSMRNVGNCFRHAALKKLKKALPDGLQTRGSGGDGPRFR